MHIQQYALQEYLQLIRVNYILIQAKTIHTYNNMHIQQYAL